MANEHQQNWQQKHLQNQSSRSSINRVNEGGAVEEHIPDKIETKAASPSEIFESRLSDLIDDVLRRKLAPGESVQILHTFWRTEFTEEERDQLINPDSTGSVHEAGRRLATAANMLAAEMPALVASHVGMKGIS